MLLSMRAWHGTAERQLSLASQVDRLGEDQHARHQPGERHARQASPAFPPHA